MQLSSEAAPPEHRHTPVLLERCIDLLAPALQAPGAVALDATLGMGGHSEALLRAAPHARVIGIDRDPAARALAGERLAGFGGRFQAVAAVYDEIPQVLADLGLTQVQAVLFDLGVSSLQLDEAARGFAYRFDGPLDMRMDPTTGITAAEVLADYGRADLIRILRTYGEERFAPRIADAVIRRRSTAPLRTSAELVDLLTDAIPAAARRTGGHPAKRTFQALRIEVNDELGVLERALPAAVDSLAVGGRLVVLSYHSLEDRLAKKVIAKGTTSSAPLGLPVELEQHRPYLRALVRGAEEAPAAERAANPRSASVRLRAAERIRSTKGPR